jgi:hypothetical protein
MPYMAFSSLCLGKKEKKPQKHPHGRSPIFNLLHWVSTVFPNALGNTVAVPLNILMKKTLLSPLSFVDLALSLSLPAVSALSLSLSLSLSPTNGITDENRKPKSQTKITDENRRPKSQTKIANEIANQNLKPHPPEPPPQVPELQPFSHCPHEHKPTSSLPQKHKSIKMRFIDKDMREKEKPERWEREIGEGEGEEEEEERCGLCDL